MSFALAGCQAAGGDPSAPQTAAPPAAATQAGDGAQASDSSDTATDAVQGQPKRHHYRSPLSQRRIRNRHAVPR